MTRQEVIEYGVYLYNNRELSEEVPSIIMKKENTYIAGKWSEYDYATSKGWKYDGSIAEEARKQGLIK